MEFFNLLFLIGITLASFLVTNEGNQSENPPPYLYKIISIDNWKKSQGNETLSLSKEDDAFIHLSTENQLEKIREKYWKGSLEFIILKVDTHQLPGSLIFEANPGGVNKYYHLYHGSIPIKAVLEAKLIKN